MFCVYEFEIFQEDNGYVVLPFGLEGATEGDTLQDALMMAAD